MAYSFFKLTRSNSAQPISGKKYRHGRSLSLDSVAFSAVSSSPRFRIYFFQIALCIALTIYICLPSHLLRDIATKAAGITNSVSMNTSMPLGFFADNEFVKTNKPKATASTSIVAACRNRQDTLRRVLPEWRKVKGVKEIVVVDWSSDPPLKPIIDSQNDGRIKLVRVSGEKSWVLSRAYNLAVNNTNQEYIVRTDCDYSLKPDLIEAHDLNNTINGFYSGNWNLARTENEVHLNGAMIFKRSNFLNVGGYDERIQTYGWDDEDLYNRLRSRKLKKLNISYDYVSHVSHGDKKRAQKGVKFAQVQIDINQLLLEKLPVWSGYSKTQPISTYKTLKSSKGYTELKAKFIPKSLQKSTEPDHLEESYSIALGRRLSGDFQIPWDLLESLNSEKKEHLLRQLMKLQQKLDAMHAGDKEFDSDLSAILLEKPPKKARILLIHAMHGLGNRMRAIASSLSFAKGTGRVPVLIWQKDAHFAAGFEKIYESGNITVLDKFKPQWPLEGLKKWDNSWGEFKFYNYMEMEEGAKKGQLIKNDPDKHIYYKGAYIMESPRFSSWVRDNRNLRSLKPVKIVRETLKKLEEKGLSGAIGVHIRNKTLQRDIKNVDFNDEYGLKASAEMEHWREQSTYTNFMIEMERILFEEDVDAKFYIATDTNQLISEFEKKFPNKVLYVPRNCDGRDAECVTFAMMDVYALSRTKRLLGSNWSSYTEMAERLGGLKAELAGQDFGVKSTPSPTSASKVNDKMKEDSKKTSRQESHMFDKSRE